MTIPPTWKYVTLTGITTEPEYRDFRMKLLINISYATGNVYNIVTCNGTIGVEMRIVDDMKFLIYAHSDLIEFCKIRGIPMPQLLPHYA